MSLIDDLDVFRLQPPAQGFEQKVVETHADGIAKHDLALGRSVAVVDAHLGRTGREGGQQGTQLARVGIAVHAQQQVPGETGARFADGQAGASAAIAAALAAGDRATAERAAHTAKGVSGNIGAHALHESAAQLEASLRANDPPERTQQLLNAFAREMEDVVASIAAALPAAAPQPAAAPTGQFDPAELEQCLKRLAGYLRESDSEVLEHLESARTTLAAACTSDELSRLEQVLQGYDFDSALKTLVDMAARYGMEL